MKRLLLFFVFSCCIATLYAQSHISIDAWLYNDEFADKVRVVWSVPKGETCTKMELEYSTDSVNFKTINRQTRSLGDSLNTISYDFFHQVDYIGKVYYRVRIDTSDYSSSIAVNLTEWFSSYKVSPNPCNRETMIEFNNRWDFSCRFILYDGYGRVVTELYGIKGNRIPLETGKLLSGPYYFVITSANGELSFCGKFLVAR